MAAIKRTPADQWFSKCIRLAAGYKCERCGAQHAENSMGLHCSHHHRRGQWATRFDPDNAEALCYGCHSLVGGTQERMDQVLTDYEQQLLRERKDDIALAKLYRKTKGKGEISGFFKAEFGRLTGLREIGVGGKLQIGRFL